MNLVSELAPLQHEDDELFVEYTGVNAELFLHHVFPAAVSAFASKAPMTAAAEACGITATGIDRSKLDRRLFVRDIAEGKLVEGPGGEWVEKDASTAPPPVTSARVVQALARDARLGRGASLTLV